MKKSLSLIVFLLWAVSLCAQMPTSRAFSVPSIQAPQKPEYANYKTYDLYVYAEQENLGEIFDGRYPVSLYRMNQDTINGDLKILVRLTSVTANRTFMSNDTAVVDVSFSVTPVVYDKDGKQIYHEAIQCNNIKGKKAGVKKDALNTSKNELLQDALINALPILLSEFKKQYLNNEAYKRSYLVEIARGKNNEAITSLNDSITVIIASASDMNSFEQTIKRQADFWNHYATEYTGQEQAIINSVALFNLMQMNIFLGNADAARSYGEKATASELHKYYKGQIPKMLENLKKVPEPVSHIVYTHEDNYRSQVSMDQLLRAEKYFPFSGKIAMKDGSSVEGQGLIERKNMNVSGSSGIASLDKADYKVEILSDGKTIQCKMSDILSIEDAENKYLLKSGNLIRTVYRSEKIEVYHPVFPKETSVCYFLKQGQSEPEHTPLIGASNWLKKYFSDCPELVKKIDKKELKEPLAMGSYYGDACQ
ncbi:MAG: hypothetical protein LBQ60_11905 [Bacteroidales bacterium]|jgi:hypothetical protein|nr:hypothetical protein [Bacteroidales bacterium]